MVKEEGRYVPTFFLAETTTTTATTRTERGRREQTKRKEKEPFIIKSFKSSFFPPFCTTAESNTRNER